MPGRHGERHVGPEPGQQGAAGRGQDRGGDDRALVHARGAQDVGIDEDDVGHRQKGRRAGGQLPADRGPVLLQLEQVVEHQALLSAGLGSAVAAADGREASRPVLLAPIARIVIAPANRTHLGGMTM